MKKYVLSAAAALLLTGYASVAQENEKNDKNKETRAEKKSKLREYDEIVIKRKNSDKDTKVTIEIKDDEVLVDGKPIEEFTDEEISVRKRGANRYRLNTPNSPFRFEEGWSTDDMELFGGQGAFLGVTTEGSSEGVRIVRVSENSAAAKAGLKKDDVITKVNDKAVFDHEQLSDEIDHYKPEDKVTITYKRNGKENKTTATLGKRSADVIARIPRDRMMPVPPQPPMVFNFDDGELGEVFQYHAGRPKLGIKVEDTEDGKGVKVLEVDEGSAADKAGIKKDDIITSFEGKDVTSATELARASREIKDKSNLKVQLNRNGKPQTIEVKVPKKLRTANL